VCGIYGELCIAADCRPAPNGDAATDLLVHRGPDEGGSWTGDRVFLGARRLAVMDPEHGRQPMSSHDGAMCLVYNGELYNFTELRRELEARGRRFATTGDTEVVLRSFEEWGTDALTRFEGMFALALWDAARRRLVLARDPIGEKPLYYHHADGRLLFASEPKAILAHPSVRPSLSTAGLGNFLAFGHAVAPETIYRGIRKLLPGHRLLAGDGEVRVERYWDLAPAAARDGAGRGMAANAARVRALLDDSVRRRLVADVPVGAFLSGGADSSGIVALMVRHATVPVQTFSVGFVGGDVPTELPAARRVAHALGTEHRELEVEAADVPAALERLVRQHDEPFADPASVPLLLLSEFAREHVKVVLTGDGGDELFGGYRRYAAEQIARPYARIPQALRGRLVPQLARRLRGARRVRRAAATLAEADPARRYAGWLRVLQPDLAAELLTRDLRAALSPHDAAAAFAAHYARLDGADHLNRLMYVDLKTWLADTYMEKTDKATMAHGLEARLPLLDRRLVELAFEIPARQKVVGPSTKRVLKRALAGIVPAEVLHRRKHGFTVPIGAWLRGELQGFAREILLDRQTRDRGFFDSRCVERLLTEHAAGRRAHHEVLWPLVTFELWHRQYLDPQ
jgi:asparagine synthase (glutamine-hydrolysing)